MRIETKELKILQAQINTDSQDIIDSLDGDINWEGISDALDRIIEKQKRFNEVVENFIHGAEAEAMAQQVDLDIDTWKEEEAKK